MDLEFWIIGSFGQTERETKGTKIPPVRWHSGNIRKTRNLSLLSVTGEDIGNELMCGAILKGSAVYVHKVRPRGGYYGNWADVLLL